jgi:hypothetical protein
VAHVYIIALFDQTDAANLAKRTLSEVHGIFVHRAFVINRDERGYHINGRFEGQPPTTRVALLRSTLARLLLGASREEDNVAVSDAEAELSVGQSALVAMIDEKDSTATDTAIHAAGGTMIRSAISTLDAEDRERFFEASSMPGIKPLP